MAVGFAIDYSSDIVFAFFVPKSMPHDERARYAMVTMAQPIFVGGLASFFCVAPLAAASVPTASVFATMVGGIVAIGIYMGFIVLPVLLTLFTPLRRGEGRSVHRKGQAHLRYRDGGSRHDTTIRRWRGLWLLGRSAGDAVGYIRRDHHVRPRTHVSVVPGSAPHPSPPPSAPSGTDDAGDDFGTAPPRRKTAWGMWAA